jgi:Flp pilus assembly protein TadG
MEAEEDVEKVVKVLLARRGLALIYLAVTMSAMLAMISIAVDFGRVEVAKTELQRAVDGAALYGSTGAADGTYSSKAIDAGNDNNVDGTPLVLLSSDIQTITWNTGTGTYTVGGASPNGVKITARRAAARGTAIPLVFAKLIGMSTFDIHATAVAVYSSNLPPFGFVGISGVLLQSNTINIDSYKSSSGSVGLTHGYVASNSGFTMSGGVTINKDIYMLAGQSITANGSPSYGTRQALTSALSYPSVSTYPVGSTNLSNLNGGVTLGSGSANTNYYTTGVSLSLNSGQTLTINGPVTLYVNGNFTINGTVNTYQNLPANFAVRMMSGSGVNITTPLIYLDVYAPQSPINIGSGTNLYGRIIGNQLSVSGNANLHYDESLSALPGTPQGPVPTGPGSGAATLE